MGLCPMAANTETRTRSGAWGHILTKTDWIFKSISSYVLLQNRKQCLIKVLQKILSFALIMRPNPRICRICSWLSSFWLTPRTPANTDSSGDLVPVSHRKSLLCQLYSHKNAQFSHLNKNDENYNKRRWVVSILGLKAFCFGLVHTKNYKT